ncbi:UNKNOWN [Stylonychia lemnae]|uniref:EamA domain-containing protein n=1 Tax=Stylonychia lemnae TaxID=5949 RepID=A0A078BCX8_STYLE|nr:UNKNOWN [Stylonychia lemnae]|eukprot:CDW91072.1 UNKNOWN [Stylonychia lemnae]
MKSATNLSEPLIFPHTEIAFEKSDQKAPPAYLFWTCVLAGVLFGVYNFLFGVISYLYIQGTYLFCLGGISIAVIYQSYSIFAQHRRDGRLWAIEKSNFFKCHQIHENQFTLNCANIRGCVFLALVIQTTLTLKLYTFRYALEIQLNQGIVSSLFALSTVTTSIIFYFAFKQKITPVQILGICFILLFVILISMSKPSQKYDNDGVKQIGSEHIMIVVLLGVFVALLFTSKAFISKIYHERHNYQAINLCIDAIFLQSLILLPFFINYQVTVGYKPFELVYGFAGSTLCIIGNILLYNGVSKGIGGPKVALSHIQGFIHTSLSLLIQGMVPNFLQIAGMSCAIIGVIIITMGQDLIKLCSKK